MSDRSAIEWTEATWNTWYGCTKVSPGCAHCYIERTIPYRVRGAAYQFHRGRIPLKIWTDRMEQPLHWRKPRRIFVNSLSDTFHEDVPNAYLAKLFNVMRRASWHTFQVLTKRPARMHQALSTLAHNSRVLQVPFWPLPNVWLGVTVENQRFADERIPLLLDTPAAVRFLSCEPLLGRLDLERWLLEPDYSCYEIIGGHQPGCYYNRAKTPPATVDWVIAGGESGGPAERRLVERCDARRHGGFGCEYCGLSGWRPKPEALQWVQSLRDQCQAAAVPFFFKQWGGPTPKSGGRLLGGREWNEMPALDAERGGAMLSEARA